jgi:hypothetical protein
VGLDAGVDLDLDPDLDIDAAADIGDTGNIGQLLGLMRTSVSSQLRDSKIAGNTANVVVPIGAGSKGKVAVDVNGQSLYLVARTYNEKHGTEYAVGSIGHGPAPFNLRCAVGTPG